MNRQTVSFDWNQARSFLVTAEEGSFTAAARVLGLTQPTLGRQVSALEVALGVTLLERTGRTLTLTPSGLDLVEHVRAMGDAAARVSLTASGQSQTIAGKVSITASDVVATYFLPPVLKHIRMLAPEIKIEVVASNAVRNLMQREADIAIRHIRPEQPDLIAKLISTSSAELYAAQSYLEDYGRPTCAADLSRAAFIGFEQTDEMILILNDMGLPVARENFTTVADNGVAAWEMVKQGLGIGIMMKEFGARTPEVECLLPGLISIPVSTWLTTHRELHTSRRIRLVFDALAEALSSLETGPAQ